VTGSALVGVLGPAVFAANPDAALFILACGLVLLAGTSILGLVSHRAGRKLYWVAMLLNGALVFILSLVPARAVLLFIVPALLNMTAIELLRRARLALERSET